MPSGGKCCLGSPCDTLPCNMLNSEAKMIIPNWTRYSNTKALGFLLPSYAYTDNSHREQFQNRSFPITTTDCITGNICFAAKQEVVMFEFRPIICIKSTLETHCGQKYIPHVLFNDKTWETVLFQSMGIS